MNIPSYASFSCALLLIGCATTDLANDPALSQPDRQLAMRMAELTKERCIHYTYEQGSPQRKLSGDMKLYALPTVKRLYKSDSGWVKAVIQADGVWGNVFLLERSATFICGDVGWQQYANSASISFREIGKPELLLPTSSPASVTAAKAPEETRPIALRWDGYPRLISGTVSLTQGERRGVVRAMLPDKEGTCSGIFEYTSNKAGQWAVSCTNGLSATGTFEALGAGKGSTGLGTDIKGSRVEFTVGGTP